MCPDSIGPLENVIEKETRVCTYPYKHQTVQFRDNSCIMIQLSYAVRCAPFGIARLIDTINKHLEGKIKRSPVFTYNTGLWSYFRWTDGEKT